MRLEGDTQDQSRAPFSYLAAQSGCALASVCQGPFQTCEVRPGAGSTDKSLWEFAVSVEVRLSLVEWL